MKCFRVAFYLLIAVGGIAQPVFAASMADVVIIVDESGSMGTEHAWLSSMVLSLDAQLNAAGVTNNQFGLVGFGDASPGVFPHAHLVGGGNFGTAAQLAAATSGLMLNGGDEDGWAGIHFALSNYAFRSGAAVNVILVTDEDRDNIGGIYQNLTFNEVLALLSAKGALLNAVLNATFMGTNTLGIDSDANGYRADGSGGYTQFPGASVASGFGTTIADYVNLATASGGAAWDLNQLRTGGQTAESFTKAFVDIKVREIVQQPGGGGGSGGSGGVVPEPTTAAIWGLGSLGLCLIGARRRKRST